MLWAAPAASQGMRYSDSYTFIKAVRDRDGTKATDMLSGPRGAIVANSKSGDTGEAAIHIVTRERDLTWLSFLLAKGARADIQDKDGNTPLTLAAQLGWAEGAEVLLSRGAAVNGQNGRGETPLILAVHARDPVMVRLLLAKGADPKRSDQCRRLFRARLCEAGPAHRRDPEDAGREAGSEERSAGPSL